jgi:hypothetical protein
LMMMSIFGPDDVRMLVEFFKSGDDIKVVN